MTSSQAPKDLCEHLLREEIRYNAEHHVFPSESTIADRLLGRGPEMVEVYDELHSKLGGHHGALQAFLGLVLSTAALWNPAKVADARAARERLLEVNHLISQRAADLGNLLQERDRLQNTTGFSTGALYHVCDLIEAAASGNSRFRSYVKVPLDAVRTQFDLKYWPTLSECLQALSLDAASASAEPSDPMTAASTAGIRPSLADSVKALYAAIEENNARANGPLPMSFKLTDGSIAAVVNCALGLGPGELVDDRYVKRLRQRVRNQASKGLLAGSTG